MALPAGVQPRRDGGHRCLLGSDDQPHILWTFGIRRIGQLGSAPVDAIVGVGDRLVFTLQRIVICQLGQHVDGLRVGIRTVEKCCQFADPAIFEQSQGGIRDSRIVLR